MSGGKRWTGIPILLLLLLATLLPTDAAAHQRLVGTEPARGAETGMVPRELRLRFAEPVQVAFTRVELLHPDGGGAALGEPRLAPDSATVLIVPVEASLRAGSYTVRWSTASRDGHPVRGEYAFVIAADAAGLVPETAVGTVPGEAAAGVPAPGATDPVAHHPAPDAYDAGFGAESPVYVLVRWLNFVALLGTIGAAAFAVLVLGYMRRERLPDEQTLITDCRRRAAAVGLGFVALLAVATLARLWAQSAAMQAMAGPDAARVGALLGQTLWGWGWLVQVAGTVTAGLGFALARRGREAGWAVAGVAALALGVTPALSGHAAAMTGAIGAVAVVADALHVLAAGGWLGSLLVLLLAGIPAALRTGPARRGPAVASLVRAFSPTAMIFAGLVILTGIVATVIHSSSLSALLGSRYGTLLLIKLGIFLLVFGTGAYNWLRVRPALGNDAGTRRLRRSATFELSVGAAVLLVTAVLVATARPYEEEAEPVAHVAAPPAGVADGAR